MKVKDVIKVLEDMDPEMEVFIGEDNVEWGTYVECNSIFKQKIVKQNYVHGEGFFKEKDRFNREIIEEFECVVIE